MPGLPLSGLWLTHEPKSEVVHTDRNTRGASFVVSSTSHQTGALVLYDEQRKRKLQHGTCAHLRRLPMSVFQHSAFTHKSKRHWVKV